MATALEDSAGIPTTERGVRTKLRKVVREFFDDGCTPTQDEVELCAQAFCHVCIDGDGSVSNHIAVLSAILAWLREEHATTPHPTDIPKLGPLLKEPCDSKAVYNWFMDSFP